MAFRRAAELYEIALAYGPWDAAGQRDLLRRQARALASAGQLDEAAQLYGRAAMLLPDDPDAIDCERARIECLLRRGHIEEALPAAERLLKQVGVKAPLGRGALRSRLGALWGQQRLRSLEFTMRDAAACKPADLVRLDALYSIVSGLAFADPALGRGLQAELVQRALECGEPVRVVLALAQEMIYGAGAGPRAAEAVDAVGVKLIALADQLGHPYARGIADTAVGIAAYTHGRWRDARASLEAGLAALHEHAATARWEIDIGESYWLGTLYYLGEWRELFRHAQTMLRDAETRNDVVAQLGVRTGRGLMGWLLANRTNEARDHIAAAAHGLPPGFSMPNILAIQAACNVQIYSGDAAAAARGLADAWPAIERSGALRVQLTRVELTMLRARATLADRTRSPEDRAKQVTPLAKELIDEGVPWAIGSGHLVQAAAHALRDAPEAALASLAQADGHLASAGMVGVQVVGRLRRAQVEGGVGGAARSEAARDQLRDLGAAEPDAVAALLVPWPA
jgi:tetratricopeptide (TPR) repeat protein